MWCFFLIIVSTLGSLEIIWAQYDDVNCPADSPPTLTYSSLNPRLGENLVLTCNVPAKNRPEQIFWSKNFDSLDNQEKLTLSFAPVLKSDAGKYSCRYLCFEYTLPFWYLSQSSNEYALTGDTPTVSFAPVKPVIGKNFTLTCNPPTYLSALKFVWLRKSSVLEGQSGRSVTFSPVVEAHKGSYSCYYYYSNNVTSELSSYYELIVSRPVPPKLTLESTAPYVLLSSYLYLICSDEDTGVDDYAFYRNGKLLENKTLPFYSRYITSTSFSGNFTCTCSNMYGESQHSNSVHIAVLGPPAVTSMVSDHVIGGDLNLTCITDLLENNIIFTWYRAGKVLNGSNQQVYFKKNITSADAAYYKCSMQWGALRLESSPFLVVCELPSKPLLYSSGNPVLQDNFFTLSCTNSSSSNYDLEWSYLYLDDVIVFHRPVDGGMAGFIEKATFRSSGAYTCSFTNSKGESQRSNPVVINVTTSAPMVNDASFSTVLGFDNDEYSDWHSVTFQSKFNVEPPQYCTLYLEGQKYAECGDCHFVLPRGINGTYTAEAVNLNGTSPLTSPSYITFYERPLIKLVSNKPPVLECVTSIQDAVINWTLHDYFSSFDIGWNSVEVEGNKTRTSIPLLASYYDSLYSCLVWKEGYYPSVSAKFQVYFSVSKKVHFSMTKQLAFTRHLGVSRVAATCTGEGTFIHLYRDGVKVAEKPAANSPFNLFITPNSLAKYACTVYNNMGESVLSDPVYVLGKNRLFVSSSSPVAYIGQPLTLNCTFNNPPTGTTLGWTIYRVNSYEKGKLEWKQTLHFDLVLERDQGSYVCTANISGQMLYADKSYVIALEVPTSPDIDLASFAVLQQNLVTFCCSISPLIVDVKKSFRVYKDGALLKITPLEESFSESTLQYQQCYSVDIVISSDVGNYSCTAINSVGESAPSKTVIIGLNITLSSNDTNPAVGKSIKLICNVPDFITDNEIFWQKDYSQLNKNGRTLLLTSLRNDDDGIYFCYCHFGKSEPFLLKLLEPLQPMLTFHPDYINVANSFGFGPVPLKFGVGSAVRLKCFAAYRSISNSLGLKNKINTKYIFTIYKNGHLVNVSDDAGSFTFSGLSSGEHNFTCKVNNGFMDSVMSFPLSVVITSQATIISSSITPIIGNSLILTCNAETSRAIITWKKNNLTIKEKSPLLQLSYLSLQDEGRYSCIQEIDGKTVIFSDFVLACSKASKPVILTNEETVVQAGNSVQIFCVVSSTTSQKSVFYQNNVVVYNSTSGALDDAGNIVFTYSIDLIDISHSGNYTCTAENTRGLSDKSNTIVLEVGCQPGYYMSTGSICFPCPYGTYQSATQQRECTPCPENLYTLQKGAAFASQCVDIPYENRVFVRISIAPSPINLTEYDLKLAIRNSMTVSFTHLTSYVGVLFHNVSLGTFSPNEVIVLASLISWTNVTKVFYNQLGYEIYGNIYRRHLTFTVAGQLLVVKTMDIFMSLNNSEYNINHIDIDECFIEPSVCSINEKCNNSVGAMGSFTCNCIDGYERLNVSSICSDINECHQINTCGIHEQCVNYIGGYRCDCSEGYTRATLQDSCTDFNRTQDSLYPFGVSVGDTRLQSDNYSSLSGLITFDNGLPFGTEKHYDVFVSKNGMISVGKKLWYWYCENFRFTNGGRAICPFTTNLYYIDSEVLYQLYKKSNDLSQPLASNVDAVFSQAAADVKESFNITDFNPNYVLVVTWVNVICNFRLYSYFPPGDAHENQHATFQTIIITDGMTSYLKFMYKYGEFEWPYFTKAFVGYVNDVENVQFVPPDSFLIPSLDHVIGNTGKYGTWLAHIGQVVNVEQLCENFFIENQHVLSDATFQNHVNDVVSLISCPCSVRWMGGLWSWQFFDHTTRCFTLNSLATRLFEHTHNKICCYHYTYKGYEESQMAFISAPPDTGYFTFYDPYPWSATYRESNLNDINPHRWCCKDTNSTRLCQLFYSVRPPVQCKNSTFIITGSAFGEPHITTLDGLKYIFNGWGEYILAWIPKENFTLQARTARVANNDSSEFKSGTVFSAIAAKERNSSFQVELSSSKDRLIIYCNEQDYTAAFYADPTFSKMIESSIFLERNDDEDLAKLYVTFSSGIQIAVGQGVRSLDFEVTMPTSLRGMTSGLLGNFNSRLNDEFQLPNGNILSANLTEKEIYYQFASLWSVTAENTVFIYPDGESCADFKHPEFVPLFFSDLNATALKSAQEICGHENVACLYDYAVTSDPIFAANTKKVDERNDLTRIIEMNSLPSLVLVTSKTSSGLVEVTEGQVASIVVSASDPDGNFHRYELIDRPLGVALNQSGVIIYAPSASNPVSISVVAVDQLGGRSSLLNIPLVMCTFCSGHGHCNRSLVRSSVWFGGSFQKYVCQCRLAYTGDDCEEDWDACSENPCSLGQTCTDTLAAVQDAENSNSHTCGPCPTGTQKVNNSCIDIDECLSNFCSHLCTNILGSYFCSCQVGYRLNLVDGQTCQDINECAERTHSCEHVCTNSPGSYNCSCLPGYSLQLDSHSCKQSLNSKICSTSPCSQICVVDSKNQTSCSCKSFYQIDPLNSTNCVDVNECSLRNPPCSQVCVNTDGGFQCSCYSGYKLSQDLTTCLACESSSYGTNCSENCLCAHSDACHPVAGCICHEGWTGPRCDVNIDECTTLESACSHNEICHGLSGSYECICRDGFTNIEGECVDVNECGDIFLHTCDLFKNQICHNTIGSFVCDCLPGYTKSLNGTCKDIDECSMHSHSCQQLCINTLGSYTCTCHYGSRLDDYDRTKCVVSESVCKNEIGLNCPHGCTIDLKTKSPFCYCLAGYSLDSDKTTCWDINECISPELNGCYFKESCVNTIGSYKCLCQPGYYLENDLRTCSACNGQTWGLNCVNSCSCTAGADTCDPETGCVCKTGFTGTLCEFDVNECESYPTPCQQFETCVNSLGSYSCMCPSGYQRVSQACADVDECQNKSVNNCDQKCINYVGGFQCSCYFGFVYNETKNRCQDVDECAKGISSCSQECINTLGSYHCNCFTGYHLYSDDVSCVADIPCKYKQCASICATVKGLETCSCPKGQNISSKNPLLCEDIDLCASSSCEQNCNENVDGTNLICSCNPGYKLSSDKVSCQECIKGKFGSDCYETCTCVTSNTDECLPVNGSCKCLPGWTGTSCDTDVDECSSQSSVCPDPHSLCVNTLGSYFCQCTTGYFMKNSTSLICEECDENFYGLGCISKCSCDPQNSICDKVTGTCRCNTGWEGPKCNTDINECLKVENLCGKSLPPDTCVNTYGGYQCVCPPGYKLSNSNLCEECDNNHYGNGCTSQCYCDPQNSVCNKVTGLCHCNTGWEGPACDSDINECLKDKNICGLNLPVDTCNNTKGGYQCICPKGYQVTSSNVCGAVYKQAFKILFPHFNSDTIMNASSVEYKSILLELQTAIKNQLVKLVKGFLDFTVQSLKKGSLIVEVEVSLFQVADGNTAGFLTNGLTSLNWTDLTINGIKQNVTFILSRGLTTSPFVDQCTLRNIIEPCPPSSFCTVNKNDISVCHNSDNNNTNRDDLYLGVGLGTCVLVLVVVAISIIVCVKLKRPKLVHPNKI